MGGHEHTSLAPSLPPTGDQRSREKAAELRGTTKGPLEVETDAGRRGGPKQPVKTLGKSAVAQTRRAGPERKVGWGGGGTETHPAHKARQEVPGGPSAERARDGGGSSS